MPRIVPPPGPPPVAQEVRIEGGAPRSFDDVYHRFLRVSWGVALGSVVVVYLLLNAGFASAFWLCGGLAGARPGSWPDSFYFSVQTMGTIGYGVVHPETTTAHLLVTSESVVGLLLTALVTGLVFAKFSRSAARVCFSDWVTIAPMDGVPTVMIRLGNERSSGIVECELRVAITRTERTKEGTTFYRLIDLQLTRNRAPRLSRGWTVMHPITADSPLHDATPATLKEQEVEILVTMVGTDDVTLQPTHAQKSYVDGAILWGRRHADMLRELPDGSLTMDVSQFQALEETEATAEFPYGHGASRFGDATAQSARRARPR